MKQIRIDLQLGEGGVGYRIDPVTKTYSSGSLKNGEFVEVEKGEIADAQKFATQLYYLILASLNDTKEEK